LKFQIKSEKNGYHCTQRTIYGRIPASEFYGFVIGIALGYIVRGVVNLSGLMEINNSDLAFVFCAIGVAIGWWYDQKYFMVKDEPEEGAAEAAEGAEAETAVSAAKAAAQAPAEREVIEGTSTQDTLRQMFARNADDDGETDE
jgi:nucleotide-binding universal stress UspA family protein